MSTLINLIRILWALITLVLFFVMPYAALFIFIFGAMVLWDDDYKPKPVEPVPMQDVFGNKFK